MLTFLNTSILIGLAAVTIPIIIHLITRQKVKKIFFSSLVFLKELKTQKIKRIKIRQILLLILRSLIILFLILAFARPTLKSKFSSTVESTAKISAVIILDNSYSMGREVDGKLLFDIAKDKVKELRDIFNDGDEIYILLAISGTPHLYQSARFNFDDIDKAINDIQLSHHSTDVLSAIKEAKNILLEAKNVNKEIYLISDLQKNGFGELSKITQPILEQTNIKLYVLPCIAGNFNNLGVVSMEVMNQLIEKGKIVEIEIVVRNFGTYEEHNKLVQLFIEGKRSAQGTINLQPGSSKKLTFKVIPDKTGLITGEVLLEDDDLLLDNQRYFTFYVPDKINALLVGDENDRKYLNLALKISPNIEFREVTLDQINYNLVSGVDVIILSNVRLISNSFISTLFDFVNAGGGLLLFLGENTDIKTYNENLRERFSLPELLKYVGESNNRNSFLSFGNIDYSHPIFKGMFDQKKGQIESPRVYISVSAKLNNQTEKIIELSNRSPFLSETKVGNGKVIQCYSMIDPRWSDIYIKGIFVPLINRSVIYLGGVTEKANRNLIVNQEINSTLRNVNQLTDLKIEKPNGTIIKLKPSIEGGNYNIKYKNTDIIGSYNLYSNEQKVDKWVVNYHPDESQTEPISEKQLKDTFGKDHTKYIERTTNIKSDVLAVRFGRELWKYFLFIVLCFLLIEMFIAKDYTKSKS